MNMLDLFSGIGGFSLAGKMCGIKTVAFCEIDKYCIKVLKKNFPEIPIFNNIKELTNERIKTELGRINIDIITGGFPCQPYSIAGEKKGSLDDRALWPEMFRVIKEIRPSWVVCENVTNLINMGIDGMLSDMENIGYASTTFIIPACAVNAKHRRNRVWIVYHANSGGCERNERRTAGQKSEDGCKIISNRVTNFLQKQKAYEQKIGLNENSWPAVESGFLRVAYGIPNRVDRIKGIGNSIVPDIAFRILNAIVSVSDI